MLTCPFCQFENTNRQRFCQQCGESLQTWLALCFPKTPTEEAIPVGPYLDANQRYRLSKRSTILPPTYPVTLQVIDCHPHHGSPLAKLEAIWFETPRVDPRHLLKVHGIPAQALPYLALQMDYFPVVPEAQDAFCTKSHDILLIEDRSSWVSLHGHWHRESYSPFQQIQWLFEMVLLWEGLVPWRLEATLLNADRLALNSDNFLCLTQLDQNPNCGSIPLTSLGNFWHQLCLGGYGLAGGVQPLVPALAQIIYGLNSGSISTLAQLKQKLADLAEVCPRDLSETATDDASLTPIISMPPSGNPSDPSSNPQAHPSIDGSRTPGGSTAHDAVTPRPPMQAAANRSTDPTEEQSDPVETPTIVLPMKLIQIDEVGQTHVGMQRNHNEDCFFAQTASIKVDTIEGTTLNSKGLYIVCDGMGGHASGEVASQLAVKTLKEFFDCSWQQELPDQADLVKAVTTANQAIYDINQANATSGLGRMGTTLVMLLIHNLKAAVVHVGDSRLYSYCKRLGLRQLTLDHEVGQREISRGVEPAIAYARPDAYQLTQALGPRHRDEVKPTISYHDIGEDTLFLLCSDGLSDNHLLERYESSHIAPLLSSKANLEAGLAELIDLANEQNGHDNVTAVLTRLKLRPDMTTLPGM